MPIYEYECKNCGRFEKWQSIKSEPLKICPKCSRKVKKLLSTVSFIFSGSGFYTTDYKHK